ncbi:SHOCT domain-containing protein [Fredinandcohnia sp. FSL W7-1320]|uniref:SHOCT domain-containing protein n=1 Tax=Fredinandcohnia sp. FSL W7-1320 TaxID=2954540 RepID=UPI0030FDDB3E
MSLEGSVKKDNLVYKNANKNVTHWHNLISHLINRADQEDISINRDKEHDYINKNQSSSIADEIKKLSELHKEGILSDEEFNSQKQKLLS